MRELVQSLLCGDLRIGGVFHATHQLADAVLSNQTVLTFRLAYGPKVQGVQSLHAATSRTPLEVFNVFFPDRD